MKTVLKFIAAAALFAVCAAAAILIMNANKSSRLIGEEQLQAILSSAEYPTEAAETAVKSAASIVGKVHYFWGGKSFCIGEDPEWGVEKTVASEGHSTTGSVRPFGLDCSGLVTWAYIQAGYSMGEIGNGTWNQWQNSAQIEKSELLPGDLGFQNKYPGSSGNHVGIFIGYYNEKPVFIHSIPSYDNVVVTLGDGIFNYYRRPLLESKAD